MTHTPGPWAIDRNNCVSIPYRGPHRCASAFAGTKENARLIAASPLLLEALQDVTELLVGTVTEFGCWEAEDHPKVIAARAAITAATGGEA